MRETYTDDMAPNVSAGFYERMEHARIQYKEHARNEGNGGKANQVFLNK